ncbi:MAG: methionine adenosyltransferase [Thaumarchaeota archaeon]|nr:methionine adenosyltransferase [Nitrososphaerota archaeon]
MIINAKRYDKNEPSVEFVERKGKGHPDTVCDNLSEKLSVALSNYYIKKTGKILHHNVDKAILVGGQSRAWFGGGEVLEPIYIMLVGRAISRLGGDEVVPIGTMALKVVKDELKRTFRYLDPESHVIVDYRIKQGSADLVGNFNSEKEIPLSNDTSFGVGFYPFTDTERLVLEAEKYLNSEKGKSEFPSVGEDIKVMGFRNEKKVTLTVAAAMISSLLKDSKEYLEIKDRLTGKLGEIASHVTKLDVQIKLNNADEQNKGIYYLTVTGTSAESGDDGQVGRGNRANGLITPLRPMTLEATAGKNPISHTGKLYTILSQRIAKKVVEENKKISSASVYMLSQIGKPITDPQSVYIEAVSDMSTEAVKEHSQPIVNEVLEKAPQTWKDILEGRVQLY